jgi:hypothetical protein
MSDGDECFAEVGGDVIVRRPLPKKTRSRFEDARYGGGQRSGVTVRAIFAGSPYLVELEPADMGHWNNPINAGHIREVTYFDDHEPGL